MKLAAILEMPMDDESMMSQSIQGSFMKNRSMVRKQDSFQMSMNQGVIDEEENEDSYGEQEKEDTEVAESPNRSKTKSKNNSMLMGMANADVADDILSEKSSK